MTPDDVPSGPVLIDTDVFSWVVWERQRYEEFGRLLTGHYPVLSFATAGELYSGAVKAGWGDQRIGKLQEAMDRCLVIPATDEVARHWGSLYARFSGQMEQNDLWIAACALTQPEPLPIATGNLSHFQPVADAFDLVLVHPDL